MLTVNISSSQTALRVPRKKITALVEFVMSAESSPLGEVDIAIVTSRRIAALNRRYLQHAGATDVLSFDLSIPGDAVAQVIVCADVAVRQARSRCIGPQRELMLYIVHGLLHVMGYDDTTPQAAEKMYARQEELLETFLAFYDPAAC
ncbi:MAG: rRNA maturation RNase YbeY [Phycisphaerae bacterium]|jgi:probable rRNA maturation factor|nr:rRNA maturation RNase YbeY [Phycisphaerae bacterium]